MKNIWSVAVLLLILSSCVSSQKTDISRPMKQTTVNPATGSLDVRYGPRFKSFRGTRSEYLTLIGCSCAQPDDTMLLVLPQFNFRTKELIASVLLAQVPDSSWHSVMYFPAGTSLTKLPFKKATHVTDTKVSVQTNTGERTIFLWKLKRAQGMRWIPQDT